MIDSNREWDRMHIGMASVRKHMPPEGIAAADYLRYIYIVDYYYYNYRITLT